MAGERRRALWAFLLVLALACGGAAGPARAGGCAIRLLASLPLRDTAGFLSIVATVDGTPASFLVDTGADAGLLAPGTVGRLGLPLAPGATATLRGTGGHAGEVPIALVRALGLGGGLVLRGVPMPIGTLPALPRIAPPVAGLLGGDLLRHFSVEFDVGGAALRLWDGPAPGSGPCGGVPPPDTWRGPVSTIPLVFRGNRVVLQARLDGRPIVALLDSGARSRIVSRRAALAAGVAERTLDTEPGGIASGVDGHDRVYHWHRFAALEIGNERSAAPVLTVAPLDEDVDLLLGADWFARHRVWISYATATLFVEPVANR